MLKIYQFLFLITVLNVINFCGFSFSATAKINNVNLERLTVEDGLSQASAQTIAQDKQGYIWFGTENGINVYDGYKIWTLTGPDNDFNKFSVNYIFVASDGLIFISLAGKGLYSYNPLTEEYRLIFSIKFNHGGHDIWRIIEDEKNDRFWFVTETTALNYDAKSNEVIKTIDFSSYFSNEDMLYGLAILNERLMFFSRSGTFLYNTELEQLIKLPPILQSHITGSNVNELESSKSYSGAFLNGHYYLGSNDGVFSFSEHDLIAFLQDKRKDIPYKLAIENVSVWQLLVDGDIIYVATTEGLYRIDAVTKSGEFLFKFGEYFKSVADAGIISLLIDSNGLLWMGSNSSGAYRWDPKSEIITTYAYDYSDSNSLSHGNVSSFISTQKNQLWVGTNNGLNHIDLVTNNIERYLVNSDNKTSFTQSHIFAIEEDYLGRLWLLTAKGIILFDTDKKNIIETNFPEATNKLLASTDNWLVIESINEYIWLVSKIGVQKIHALTGEVITLDDLPDYFVNKYVWHIVPSFSDDPNEVLISGTDTLWQYNELTKKLTTIYHHKEVSQEGYTFVDNWSRDSNGLIWLSYLQVGLLAIDPDSYEVKHFYDDRNSILDLNLYGVQVDKADNIWVSSHSGLYQLRASDKHMRRFNKFDGLASSEFNAGAFLYLDNENFVYGGISGVSVFNPITLNSKNINDINTVSIVKVDTLSRPLNSSQIFFNNKEIDLNYDDFGIRIDFSDFTYGKNDNPTFKYGFVNGVEFPETQQNFVVFPHLDSGEYTFRVQVKSTINGEYSAPALLQIHVNYAPWASPIAYAFYIFVFITIISIWLRARFLRQHKLHVMANYDHLTNLPNRSLLLNRLNNAISVSRRNNAPIALFFIDLDRFKQVNDSLGHEFGDLVLKEVATLFTASLRSEDTLARIGGDEFVVLLERFNSINDLAHIAQKIIDIVQKPFTLQNNMVSIGASIGISLYPNDAEDSEQLFRNADVAMYHAKQLGRNNYQFFTEKMNKEAKSRLTNEANLKIGLNQREFFNVYQPIIDTSNNDMAVGAELLMRWRHQNKIIPPIEFIALAEELGMLIPMTEQALERGFTQLQLWRKYQANFYLSVNFSVKHFNHKSLISSIRRLLNKFDLPATALKIEITESAFIVEPEQAIETMRQLVKMGVLLSLDDFGTGFSSLSYLKRLPLNVIKIDRSFVNGIGVDEKDEAIIEATLVLAKSLGMQCVAEGVETQEQLNYLVSRQCYYIQGYLYSKPLIAEEFIKIFTKLNIPG